MSKVLILGGGGREHALAWAVSQSSEIEQVFVAPGNVGTAQLDKTENVQLDILNPQEVVKKAKELEIDLVIVGPEKPLIAGVTDALRADEVLVFGPSAQGAQLEGSKVFSSEFLKEFSIPQPQSFVFDDFEKASKFVKKPKGSLPPGFVIKADGLADGKGVTVCDTAEEAITALHESFVDLKFGEAGKKVVIQEKLVGFEASVHVLTDGKEFLILPTAEDHKQLNDGDHGPMTGGMGVVSPHQVLTEDQLKMIEEKIVQPTIQGIQKRQIDFRGVLFIGLMITEKGPMVLEYNVRFGDPETQAMLSVLNTSQVFPLLLSVATGTLHFQLLEKSAQHSIVVTLASEGYPQSPVVGRPIYGLESLPTGVNIFHAGTKFNDKQKVITSGGRVLSVVATGETADEAYEKAYAAIGEKGVRFEGMYYRKDIGRRSR